MSATTAKLGWSSLRPSLGLQLRVVRAFAESAGVAMPLDSKKVVDEARGGAREPAEVAEGARALPVAARNSMQI